MKHIEVVLSTGKVIGRDCEDWEIDEDGDIAIDFQGNRTMWINSEFWVTVEGDD